MTRSLEADVSLLQLPGHTHVRRHVDQWNHQRHTVDRTPNMRDGLTTNDHRLYAEEQTQQADILDLFLE